jgi:hypothetical protein
MRGPEIDHGIPEIFEGRIIYNVQSTNSERTEVWGETSGAAEMQQWHKGLRCKAEVISGRKENVNEIFKQSLLLKISKQIVTSPSGQRK